MKWVRVAGLQMTIQMVRYVFESVNKKIGSRNSWGQSI
jgi:hypothetical protein